METEEEKRKSSVETEMENYLKTELSNPAGGDNGLSDVVQDMSDKMNTTTPDIVKDLNNSLSNMSISSELTQAELSPESELSLHTATESMGLDSEDSNTQKDTEMTSEIISVDDIDEPTRDGEGNTNSDSSQRIIPNEEQLPKNSSIPQRGANLAISIPRIQVSPETSPKPNTDSSDQSKASDLPLCPSPSRIPSRKNSAVTSQVISEDLKKLESRLEKFVPKSSDGSECSEGSDGSGKSATNVSRLHYSQTASSRAKASEKSGSVSPQDKTTSNMLKTTLRKMTRFSMGGNGKKKDTNEAEIKKTSPEVEQKSIGRSRNPFNGKSRVPKSQSPAPGVGRSKSFKEPAPPGRQNAIPTSSGYGGSNGSTARNNVYTSSLRRTKIKHQMSGEENTDTRDSSRDASHRPITPDIGNQSPWNSTLRREKSCLLKRCKRLSGKRGRSHMKGGAKSGLCDV